MILTVLTISIGTTVVYTTQSQHESGYGKAKSYAYVLAENGINQAEAILNNKTLDPVTGSGMNALDPASFCALSLPAGSTYDPPGSCTVNTTYDGGYVKWSGSLNTSTNPAKWTITSTGYVVNPAGAATETRTLTVTIKVYPTLSQQLKTPIWNYLYATKPASTWTGQNSACDMSVTSSAKITSPLYVEGNLCMGQTSNYLGGPLIVKGVLEQDKPSTNYVGQNGNPITELYAGGNCASGGMTVTPATCTIDGSKSIWSKKLDPSLPSGVAPPTVQWANWYLNANPGPYFPCTTTSGSPPVFDTPVDPNVADTDAQKLVYMNNNQAVQNLTPANSYSCSTTGGSISWDTSNDPATGKPKDVLTVSGTMFIDGSIYISNGATNVYSGQGVIYASGSVLIKNSSLCGVRIGDSATGSCDMRVYDPNNPSGGGWNPNTNLLAFIANGSGGQTGVGTGESVVVTSGNGSYAFQGAAFGTYAVTVGGGSNIDGPMVGSTLNLGQQVTTNFPSITIVPNGMPANPTGYAQPDPPSNYSG
jgi:hypothetical protein